MERERGRERGREQEGERESEGERGKVSVFEGRSKGREEEREKKRRRLSSPVDFEKNEEQETVTAIERAGGRILLSCSVSLIFSLSQGCEMCEPPSESVR